MTTAAAVLALLSSLLYGVGDFALGIASRRNSAFGASFVFQLAGVLPLGVMVAVNQPPLPREQILVAGLAGGGCLAVGGFLFVSALAKGQMGVVAPITAVGAAGVPVLVGVLRGEQLSAVATFGIVAAAVGLVLVTTGQPHGLSAGGVPEALGAALGFGGLFVFLRFGSSGGWWTVGISRLVVVVATAVVAVALRRSVAVRWSSIPALVFAAALSAFAAAAFLFAQHYGELGLTAILASLYPAVTTFLAAVVLGERISGRQRIGVLVILISVLCISVP